MPTPHDLRPFHYALFEHGERTETLCFYAKTQKGADRKALEWVRRRRNRSIKRIRRR